MVKNLPVNAGNARDMGSIPGLGRSPGVGNGNPLQYSCLENPMDRGAWWATVHSKKLDTTEQLTLSIEGNTHDYDLVTQEEEIKYQRKTVNWLGHETTLSPEYQGIKQFYSNSDSVIG